MRFFRGTSCKSLTALGSQVFCALLAAGVVEPPDVDGPGVDGKASDFVLPLLILSCIGPDPGESSELGPGVPVGESYNCMYSCNWKRSNG